MESAPALITFAVATYGSREILANNLLASPCFENGHPHQILIEQDSGSAAEAYNRAIDEASNDLIVFVHNDVILPRGWTEQLQSALEHLEAVDPEWGVLGCFGVTSIGEHRGYLFSPGPGILGAPFQTPQPVRVLDEIVLILRKSSGLRFDATLPSFHLYGTDICLRADAAGRKSYVVPAFCIHNANHYLVLPRDFYTSCRHIRRVWRHALPIQTPCITITRWNGPLYVRRLKEVRLRVLQRGFLAPRMTDIRQLVRMAEASVRHG